MRFTYDDTDERLAERDRAKTLDHAMNKELAELPEEHHARAAMALRPNGGPAGSWATICAEEAREAQERDRTHEERQQALGGRIEQLRESDPAKAELWSMQKDGEQKAYEADLWKSIARKEFAMRGDTSDYQDYRREAREATEERNAIQERFKEAREAYDQSRTGEDRPGFQRRLENSRLDKPDPDKPTQPGAAAAPTPQGQESDAIAPQDREQWLKDRGANAMFIKTATSSDQRFEFARKAFEAQGRESSPDPSPETVARLDARAEQRQAAQDKPEQTDQTEEARNRPRMR